MKEEKQYYNYITIHFSMGLLTMHSSQKIKLFFLNSGFHVHPAIVLKVLKMLHFRSNMYITLNGNKEKRGKKCS